MTTELPAPGWYPDPSGKPGQTYWDGQNWFDHLPAAMVPSDGIDGPPPTQGPTAYAHKNPIQYGLGGVFLPPLVLFLMGGNRTTCLYMLGAWALILATSWMLFGLIFLLPLYIWSMIACYQEAAKQNAAHGLHEGPQSCGAVKVNSCPQM